MRINEAAERAGVTPKNIRFYEQEKLLVAAREQGNRYRSYTEEDVETLKKIRLLRMVDLPLAEIRSVIQEEQSLQNCLQRHQLQLEEYRKTLESAQNLCKALQDGGERMETLSVEKYLHTAAQQQEEGACFIDVSKRDKDRKRKLRGAVLGAAIFILFMAFTEALMLWGFLSEPSDLPPLPLLAVFLGIPLICIAATLAALYSRLKEIKKGEEDAYRDY